jgi:hypothetical protein
VLQPHRAARAIAAATVAAAGARAPGSRSPPSKPSARFLSTQASSQARLFASIWLPHRSTPSRRERRRRSPPCAIAARSPHWPTTPRASLAPNTTPRAACCPSPCSPRREPEPPPPCSPVAVERRRAGPLRPNRTYPALLGELVVLHGRLPGRDRRRLAGIWLCPCRRPARDPIAEIQLLLGCFK